MTTSEFQFDLTNRKNPLSVLQDICEKFTASTRGYVLVQTEPYEGQIFTYRHKIFDNALSTVYPGTEKDIQQDLGEIDGFDEKTYEVCFASKVMQHLKWRLMFIRHGLGYYPVTVVLQKDIAFDIEAEKTGNYVFTLNNEDELREFFEKVFITKTVKKFAQSVITESLIREDVEQKDDQEE